MEGNKGEKMSMGEKWACLGQGATRQAPQAWARTRRVVWNSKLTRLCVRKNGENCVVFQVLIIITRLH